MSHRRERYSHLYHEARCLARTVGPCIPSTRSTVDMALGKWSGCVLLMVDERMSSISIHFVFPGDLRPGLTRIVHRQPKVSPWLDRPDALA
jgi:hypothetical protein